MKQAAITFLLATTLVLGACSSKAPPADTVPVPTPVVGTSSASSVTADSTVRIIPMTVTTFKFEPNAVTLKKGEKVKIRITGIEGVHGIGVPALGINVPVNPGETVDIDVPTDTAGTYEFYCTIPCGPGHDSMKGTIVIEA
ncbi:MAG: cytochrome c oxidase subunit [Candidatus Peribacteria bacterium]|nr:cytochrome c oxidase subunit [Candidatus Peribacteria bacterium]